MQFDFYLLQPTYIAAILAIIQYMSLHCTVYNNSQYCCNVSWLKKVEVKLYNYYFLYPLSPWEQLKSHSFPLVGLAPSSLWSIFQYNFLQWLCFKQEDYISLASTRHPGNLQIESLSCVTHILMTLSHGILDRSM